jgi:hypothetical protein
MSRDDPFYHARKSMGLGLADHTAQPDMVRMRSYRMARLQTELRRLDYAAAVLYDPINIRYATGSRNMAVWTMHNPARYAFVPADGKAVIFDFHGCAHLSDGIETIAEVRPAAGGSSSRPAAASPRRRASGPPRSSIWSWSGVVPTGASPSIASILWVPSSWRRTASRSTTPRNRASAPAP